MADLPNLNELSELTIRADRFDRRVYREMYDEAPTLQAISRQGMESLPRFETLVQDIFSGLYKMAPELIAEEAIRPDYRLNRGLIEKAQQTQEWQQLRVDTVLDAGAAVIGTMMTAQTLLAEVQKNLRLQEMVQKAKEAAKAAEEAARKEMEGDDEGAAESRQQAEELAQAVGEALEANVTAVRVAARRAADAGQKATDEALTVFRSWGLGHEGRKTVSVEKQLELLKVLAGPTFKDMAAMVGRYREMARGKMATKANRPAGDIHGIQFGRNLERALPMEIARLAHPIGRYDAVRRMNEGSMMEYALRGRVRLGKGKMVIPIDTSGSTTRQAGKDSSGRPYLLREWILSMAMGLYAQAQAEKQGAAFIPFDDGFHEEDVVELAPGEVSADKLLKMATTWYGGGTNFQKVLDKGLQLIKGGEYQDGDIALITDGEYEGWDDAWVKQFEEEKARLGFRVFLYRVRPTRKMKIPKFFDVVRTIEPNDQGMVQILDDLG